MESVSSKCIRTATKKFQIPIVIRLNKFIEALHKRKVVWRNKNLFIRDNFTCQYCGKRNLSGRDLTVDHVIPKSKGGKDTFENTVTACRACNCYKADRFMDDIGLYFYVKGFKPYTPNFMEYIQKKKNQS